ncbi:MAG: hypothetical protein ACRDPW_03425 [Mycobacteriales bacterium]
MPKPEPKYVLVTQHGKPPITVNSQQELARRMTEANKRGIAAAFKKLK